MELVARPGRRDPRSARRKIQRHIPFFKERNVDVPVHDQVAHRTCWRCHGKFVRQRKAYRLG